MDAQRRVVVGVDGSASSRAALQRAVVEAAAHGALLQVLHAWNYLDQSGPEFDPHYGEEEARERIEGFVDEVLGADRPGVLDVHMVNDHAGPALVTASEGAFTVVVGARGHGGLREMLLGSVSKHLVHHATCPVLIVR